jgi:DNA-binding response OmpR family regulator
VPVYLAEDGPGGPPDNYEPKPPRLSVVGGGKTGRGPAEPLAVLVVEDDPAMRMLCEFNLKVAGFRVVTAATGREGIECARAERFDVILLDVMLPDLGGFEIAERLRTGETTRGVPFVFVSARASSADLARGRAAGAIDYVTKPFDPVGLAARLREDLDELGRGSADSVWELRFGSPEG